MNRSKKPLSPTVKRKNLNDGISHSNTSLNNHNDHNNRQHPM